MGHHKHFFKDLKVYPIKKVHKDYEGTPGDRAFLTEKCECGKARPRNYGRTSDMKRELKEIENEQV